mgnify:FL=1
MILNKYATFTTIEESTLIINSSNQKALVLDAKGTEIWKLIEQGKSKSEILIFLTIKYPETEVSIIDRDLEEFIESLKDCEVLLEDEV